MKIECPIQITVYEEVEIDEKKILDQAISSYLAGLDPSERNLPIKFEEIEDMIPDFIYDQIPDDFEPYAFFESEKYDNFIEELKDYYNNSYGNKIQEENI